MDGALHRYERISNLIHMEEICAKLTGCDACGRGTASNRGRQAMTEAHVSRGEYAKSERTRREIIAAAVDVFSEAGFRDGALRDVADLSFLEKAQTECGIEAKSHN